MVCYRERAQSGASGEMPSKIFVNYRRDDDPNGAARVCDGLAAKFGKASVFMDVDNLLAGQRFDEELAKALTQCDVLIAVMGPRWMELLQARAASGERDYVREEIAEALARKLTVIPVRVGRDGQLPPLPRRDDLPEDIRDLVLYQKHDVAHERFGRDIVELIEAIGTVRRASRPPYAVPRVPWGWMGAGAAVVTLAVGYAVGFSSIVPLPWFTALPADSQTAEVERLRVAAAKAEEDRKSAQAEAARLRADSEARRKADEEARAKLAAETVATRKVEEAEQQRQAALQTQEEDRRQVKAAAVEKRGAEEQGRQHDPVASLVPGSRQSARDCPVCPEMVVVPAGRFTMGSLEAEPARPHLAPSRPVTIPNAFAIGKFEVTFAEWEACALDGDCLRNQRPSDQGWGRDRRPVINVSWDDAKQYLAWLSRKTGKTYRLLSDAEWEFAARAGGSSDGTYSDNDRRLREIGWFTANSGGKTQPVGGKSANAFGLHDLHGNVFEWVEDCYQANSFNLGAWWEALWLGCRMPLVRGGSWDGPSFYLRPDFREWWRADHRSSRIGFRVARALVP